MHVMDTCRLHIVQNCSACNIENLVPNTNRGFLKRVLAERKIRDGVPQTKYNYNADIKMIILQGCFKLSIVAWYSNCTVSSMFMFKSLIIISLLLKMIQ